MIRFSIECSCWCLLRGPDAKGLRNSSHSRQIICAGDSILLCTIQAHHPTLLVSDICSILKLALKEREFLTKLTIGAEHFYINHHSDKSPKNLRLHVKSNRSDHNMYPHQSMLRESKHFEYLSIASRIQRLRVPIHRTLAVGL